MRSMRKELLLRMSMKKSFDREMVEGQVNEFVLGVQGKEVIDFLSDEV